jgi:hypothetical protein
MSYGLTLFAFPSSHCTAPSSTLPCIPIQLPSRSVKRDIVMTLATSTVNWLTVARCGWRGVQQWADRWKHHVPWLTSWSTALEKLTDTQPVTKFLRFYRTQRSSATFTTSHHWSLSWARWIHYTPSHPIPWRSILILTSHLCLGLQSGLLPSGFPTEALHVFLQKLSLRCLLLLVTNLPVGVAIAIPTDWNYTVYGTDSIVNHK